MTRVLRRVLNALVILVAVTVFLGVGTLFWLVRHDGWTLQTVATGSMAPTVPTGSVILSKPVTPATVHVGDVIVFVSPVGHSVQGGKDGYFSTDKPMLVTHRVIAIKQGTAGPEFTTKGDANKAEDPWTISADAVKARVVTHLPAVGGWLERPAMRRDMYLVVAGMGLLVIASESRRMVREIGKSRAAKAAASGDTPAAPEAATPEAPTPEVASTGLATP